MVNSLNPYCDVREQHDPLQLAHHVQQGQAWLSLSEAGERTAYISYAALELRFAAERLATHYWAVLLNHRPTVDDMRTVESFGALLREIWDLAGHQQKINSHFEFMRVVMAAVQLPHSLPTPQIGQLQRVWTDCSALCHVAWPLSSSVPSVRADAFASLTRATEELNSHLVTAGWPIIEDSAFKELRDQYAEGRLTEEDIRGLLREKGLYVTLESPDGKEVQFVGVPLQPGSPALPPGNGVDTPEHTPNYYRLAIPPVGRQKTKKPRG